MAKYCWQCYTFLW